MADRRTRLIAEIYKKTPRDYRTRTHGTHNVMLGESFGFALVPLESLSMEQLERVSRRPRSRDPSSRGNGDRGTRSRQPVKLRPEPITWRTDDLTIGSVETILGRDHVAKFFEDRSRKRAINAAVARARGAWDANDRERYAAYRSLARLLGRRYEE